MHTGGLGGYGSGDSEDERSDRGSESSDTDDEELRHRIRQKQEAFWRKEKEQQLLHDKQMEGINFYIHLILFSFVCVSLHFSNNLKYQRMELRLH